MASIDQLTDELISIYKVCIGEKNLEKVLSSDSEISKKLKLLTALNKGLDVNKLSTPHKFELYYCLSDALTLSSASGTKREVFDPIKISDTTNLDRKAKIKSIFEGKPEKLFEWLFSKCVQADINNQFETSCKDLESDPRFKKKRVCDYLIEKNEIMELIECKRLNLTSKPENWIKHCSNKILNHFSLNQQDEKKSAAWQFTSTKEALEIKAPINHLIINITGYSKKGMKKSKIPNVKFIGFHEEEINVLAESIKRKVRPLNNIIDKLTITWEEQVFINNIPISISTLSTSILFKEHKSIYNFNRGSIEAYPDKHGRIFHIRGSKASHTHAYYKDTYTNIKDPDNFGTSSEWKLVTQ